MLKKLPIYLSLALFASASFAQTIVSTSPENKDVVLEEFTGIHCVWCPEGHAVAQGIQDANPDRVSLINIHVGGFATPGPGEPDFRTPYGDAIANQSGLTGYPSGTVNRHIFSGNKTALGRGQWSSAANQIMAAASDVNVAVEAEIDVNTGVITVHMEGYYTADSPESTNLLNIALLQDNTKGPQTGGGQGNNYNHMHRLVEMITGQWGEEISTTTAGTFVDRTFNYTIPADFNGVPTSLADMVVVAFISNTHQEIPSGATAYPSFAGLSNNDAKLKSITEIPVSCDSSVAPEIEVQNLSESPLTSLAIEYSINGESNTYNWTGNISPVHSEKIELPEVAFTLQPVNTVVVTLADDDNNDNNSASTEFEQATEATGTVDLTIETDNHGSQVRWKIRASDGSIAFRGGPFDNNTTINERINLVEDCYEFELSDTGGDGGNVVTLVDNEGTEIFHTDGDYEQKVSTTFKSNGVLGTNNINAESISLYPNPATSVLNLRNAENADIQVYDLLGKMIFSKNDVSMDEQIDVTKLQTGTYFMKISKDNSVTTKRFLISN